MTYTVATEQEREVVNRTVTKHGIGDAQSQDALFLGGDR